MRDIRSVVLEEGSKCAKCGLSLMDASRNPFYVFPCKTAFRLQCLLEEVYPLLGEKQQSMLVGLLQQSSYVVDYKKVSLYKYNRYYAVIVKRPEASQSVLLLVFFFCVFSLE